MFDDRSLPPFDWPGIWRFARLVVQMTVGFGLLLGGTFAILDGQDFDPLFALEMGALFAALMSVFYIGAIAWTRFSRRAMSRNDERRRARWILLGVLIGAVLTILTWVGLALVFTENVVDAEDAARVADRLPPSTGRLVSAIT